MAQAPKFDALVAAVDKAEKALADSKDKLNEALTTVDVGFVVTINELPYNVALVGGKKIIKPMLTKRQIAAIRGEVVPPVKSRKRRTAEELAKAAE